MAGKFEDEGQKTVEQMPMVEATPPGPPVDHEQHWDVADYLTLIGIVIRVLGTIFVAWISMKGKKK